MGTVPYSHLDLSNRDSQVQLTAALESLRQELELRADFPPEVLAEAKAAVDSFVPPERDLTGLGFITVDLPDQPIWIKPFTWSAPDPATASGTPLRMFPPSWHRAVR